MTKQLVHYFVHFWTMTLEAQGTVHQVAKVTITRSASWWLGWAGKSAFERDCVGFTSQRCLLCMSLKCRSATPMTTDTSTISTSAAQIIVQTFPITTASTDLHNWRAANPSQAPITLLPPSLSHRPPTFQVIGASSLPLHQTLVHHLALSSCIVTTISTATQLTRLSSSISVCAILCSQLLVDESLDCPLPLGGDLE